MSGEAIHLAPRKYVSQIRVHDYLYDSAFIVSGARDYARTAFKAAMESAQLCIQPVYSSMFSELRMHPRMRVVYHPNCRLPNHIDRSYSGYLQRLREGRLMSMPELDGKDRFKFTALPRKVLSLKSIEPDFHPPTPVYVPQEGGRPRNRGTQSQYRESSAQTIPWQPDGRAADSCETTPEVLYLDKLEWGPGMPYRIGDLPADFHTTEIINKMRHARIWTELVEKGQFPRWMKKRDEIICDVETKDWLFREAEIDELQEIRLSLLHKLQAEQRGKQANRISKKLNKLWAAKKQEMERKVDHIRKTRDRELRKLSALHSGGGRAGLVQRMRAARGGGDPSQNAADPASVARAPPARDGYQASRRHATIAYDPSLLAYEDHLKVAEPPAWLEQCGQNLKRTCSGHHLPRDPQQLCERETKWSEKFLENLHEDLKKARLGATSSAGPLRMLKPRRVAVIPRPQTPEVEGVQDDDEICHQAALTLQRIIRGRAVQCLMYEGRTRAAELTEELKTTHGLQREDRIRIAKEESKAREFTVMRTEAEQKEDAITALVDELCGGAVSAALDFLEKELRRLKEERRQHAFVLIALREKAMREAAEAGRRQKEEHRRKEHDEMFKQILGVTQETVDVYLREIIAYGVALAAEEEAVRKTLTEADVTEVMLKQNSSMSTAEENELVAEMVHQFLLPHAQRTAAEHRINAVQRDKLESARREIFGVLDDAEIKEAFCIRCGRPLGEDCHCHVCPITQEPVATDSRLDPRWKHTRRRPGPPVRTPGDRCPPYQEFRCMLNTLIDEVIIQSRERRSEEESLRREYGQLIREGVEMDLDARDMVTAMIDRAMGLTHPPAKVADYHHFMLRKIDDALSRSEPFHTCACPKELPSEIRYKALLKSFEDDPTCRCEDDKTTTEIPMEVLDAEQTRHLLPSEIRILEEMRKCKCDTNPPSPVSDAGEQMSEITEEHGDNVDEGANVTEESV